jgi:hypothetical protein
VSRQQPPIQAPADQVPPRPTQAVPSEPSVPESPAIPDSATPTGFEGFPSQVDDTTR